MLHKLSLGTANIDKYRAVETSETIDTLISLGEELKGLRVCHINSTPFGGGVAEMLVCHIPLARSLGIEVDWQIIRGDRRFFTITKGLHNALQGAPFEDINKENIIKVYQNNNLANARELDPNYDVFIVNDPQPAALRHYLSQNKAKWIWRCHVDSAQPDKAVWNFLRPYIEEYDAAVFTTKEFIPKDLELAKIVTMAPAICAFSSKNMFIKRNVCRELVENLGFDTNRPLITQVSRFDRWKDPFGTIAAYKLAKRKIPGLQLALVGSFAPDDPEGWDLHAAISDEANKDDDIFVFSNLTGVGSMEVNAFQRASDVIVQKSIREGFGLVVAEALWKETPVIAGNAGGIPLQMTGKLSDYLVNSVEECAEKIVYLLENPAVSRKLGKIGKETVRQNFLFPRLIKDELKLIKSLVGK
ncbi:glycosyl transferase family 1 [Candidatus Bathyarchaeota archaeon]|nr:glycosyl transferase family 1 [Candidatus Bathyarchaeota archaeon]